MKSIINLAAMLLVLTFLSSTVFAQEDIVVPVTDDVVHGTNWVDADGDGICDNFGTDNQGKGTGNAYGLKDGSGTQVRPQDGTGYGKVSGAGSGTGVCDGTGSKGTVKRSGRN
ncbi:MAG: hypothetical protein IPH62_10060 [Ignavibacteriae bacterium]|nr:hypothetical protein [Ignavibacteriota bacterium]